MFNEEKKYIVIPKDRIIEWETRNDGITKITFHPTSATIDAKNSIARFHDDAIDSLKYFTTKAISENSKGGIEKDMKILNIYEDYQIIKIKEKTKKEKQNFVEYWGYDIQMSLYQEIVRQNIGLKLPTFLCVATKETITDFAILEIDNERLDYIMENVIKPNIKIFNRIKNGELEIEKCHKCNYCKSIKKIDKIINYKDIDI